MKAMRAAIPILLLAGASVMGVPVAAQESDEVAELIAEIVGDIPEDVLTEPGNTELPTRLAELLDVDLGLGREAELELRARVAEAWIGAEDGERAATVAKQLLDQAGDRSEWRDRAGAALVAAWHLDDERAAAIAAADDPEVEAQRPTLSQRLEALGEFGPEVVARARILDGRERMARGEYRLAAAHFDGALAVLGDSPDYARARVPAYTERVAAMEAAGDEGEVIVEWLRGFEGDPAVDLVLATLLTDSQKLVGRPAPELSLPRLDGGGDGPWSLATHRGSITVIYVFATWCKPCAPITPEVVAFAEAHPEVAVVGVSLDNRDTVGRIDAYRTRYGIEFPVVGESLGWDGEADDLLHVDAIPHIIVVGPEGRIAAVDIIGADAEATAENLRTAVAEIAPPGAEAVQAEVAPVEEAIP